MGPVNKINFNTKHLRAGDPLPPYHGMLRLYNMRYCPFAHRIVLALNAKQLNYEVVNINLVEKPEWLPMKSPLGKVPALEIKENISIYESLVTVEYLNDAYSRRPLQNKDPILKAYDKIIIEVFTPVTTLLFMVFKSPNAITEPQCAAYHNALAFVQDQLNSRGTKFLDEDQPGYGDYMIWPWFERIWMLQERDVEPKLKVDEEKYGVLIKYIKSMFEDPAVIQYFVPKENLLKFIKAYRKNEKIDYDSLLGQ